MRASILFFFLTLLMSTVSFAKPPAVYQRAVEFEWEKIEEAQVYEVELYSDQVNTDGGAKAPLLFKTPNAKWAGKLEPGHYKMRLRSKDYRGVPGNWSELSEFPVLLEKVVAIAPAPNAQIQTQENKDFKLRLNWRPVEGASDYVLEIKSADGKILASETLEKTEYEIKLPVGANYKYSVRAQNENRITSSEAPEQEFTLIGKKLETPSIQTPENPFVREITWEKSQANDSYEIQLNYYDTKTKKLRKFKSWDQYSNTTLPFESDWEGGRYQLNIRATGKHRPSSQWSRIQFQVHGGDRSPAAEYVATVRKSIERVSGWYAIASYLITEVTYGNSSADKNTYLNFNAIGGTARLGAGWFHPDSKWGFLTIADISGFTVKGKTHTYNSAEVSGVYRSSLSERAEFRFHAGGFYKQFPELVASTQINNFEAKKVTSLGPHLGTELWYSLNPKIGLQIHAHAYYSLVGPDSPNGQSLNPTLSHQFGLMGSYRFTQSFTGLAGFTVREDRTSYSRAADSTNTQFSNNESKISGNYLNFYAEWAF